MKFGSLTGGVKVHRVFIRDVASTFSVRILSSILSLATSVIIARWLGPQGKGVVALALLVPNILALVLSFGIEVANVYFAGSRRVEVSKLTGNSLTFALIGTAVGTGLVGVLVATRNVERLVPGVPAWLLFVGMLGLPIGLLSSSFNAILQGLQRISRVNGISLVRVVGTLTFTAFLVISLKLSSLGVILASLGAGLLSLIAAALLLLREGGTFGPIWDRSVLQKTLSFGLQGYVGNLLQFFNYRLDMFIVNFFLGAAGVGIYGVAVALAEFVWYLPNAIGFVIFPKAAASRPELMNEFTPKVFGITLASTMLGSLPLVVFGHMLINFLFSASFAEAYVPMLALLPGVVLLGGGKVLANEIAGRGYPIFNSINSGLALGLTVVLDLALIPSYGILGASIASSISYSAIFVGAIVSYVVVSRKTSRALLWEVPNEPPVQ